MKLGTLSWFVSGYVFLMNYIIVYGLASTCYLL